MLDVSPRDEQPEIEKRPPERRGPSPASLLIAAAVMIGLGYFLAIKLRDMSRIQDCVMSGRTNCAAVTGVQQ
jgi:hypothetical protein